MALTYLELEDQLKALLDLVQQQGEVLVRTHAVFTEFMDKEEVPPDLWEILSKFGRSGEAMLACVERTREKVWPTS